MGNINITDKAISKIQEVLASQGMKYFRIKVKGGGCSGFQYIFKSDNQLNSEKDIIFNFKDLQILVDKNSIKAMRFLSKNNWPDVKRIKFKDQNLIKIKEVTKKYIQTITQSLINSEKFLSNVN